MINMCGHNKQTRSMNVWLFLLIHLSVWWNGVISLSAELPCHFLDSINITDGILQPNKSIIFGGTVFSEGQYAEIDYILNGGNEYEPVKLYTRGCLCKHKPCIRFCCSFGSHLASDNEINDCHFNESIIFHRNYSILDQNNDTKRIKLDQQFEIIDERPCTALYTVEEKYEITHVR